MVENQDRYRYCRNAFKKIQQEYRIPKTSAQGSNNICSANIAAANLADVDARHSTSNVAKRHRANKIADDCNDY